MFADGCICMRCESLHAARVPCPSTVWGALASYEVTITARGCAHSVTRACRIGASAIYAADASITISTSGAIWRCESMNVRATQLLRTHSRRPTVDYKMRSARISAHFIPARPP